MVNERLTGAAARFVLRMISSDELPDIAVQALSEECNSPSLRRMAVLGATDLSIDGPRLFQSALLELGIPLPSQADAAKRLAREVAEQIVRGECPEYEGAKQIWSLCDRAGRALAGHDLDPFIYAASEWEDRPADRRLFEKAIRAEAVRLLEVIGGGGC